MGATSSVAFQSLTVSLVLILIFFGNVQPEPTLYQRLDNVESVNSTQLRKELGNPNTGKLVQFFNSFFGESQRYVPSFSEFARSVYKWQRLLRIFAIDCAQEQNVEICRMYDVERTPSLRYYSPKYRNRADGLGDKVDSSKPSDIIEKMKNELSKIKSTPMLGPVFEEIGFYETVKSIFGSFDSDGKVRSSVEYLVLVFVNTPETSHHGWKPHWWYRSPSYGGPRWHPVERPRPYKRPMPPQTDNNPMPNVLLDLLPYWQVRVRYLQYNPPTTLRKFHVGNESLVIIDRFGNPLALTPARPDKESYVEAVKKYLDFFDHSPQPTLPSTNATKPNEFLDAEQKSILNNVLKLPRRVYLVDLEQAIYTLLHIVLPKVKDFRDSALRALKDIITAIYTVNPLNANGNLMIAEILENLNSLKSFNSTLSGEEFGNLVRKANKFTNENDRKVFRGKQYAGCIGSRPFTRGFTCSLWTLFHYMTIWNAKSPFPQKPGFMLSTILRFVKNLLDCEECSKNLPTTLDCVKNIKTHDAEILCLWEIHNTMNQMLANDPTEDSMFPKIQFPSQRDCPSCHSLEKKWNNDHVISYLKSLYAKDKLSLYGLPNE
ncbi:hypothetical protein KR067_012519 [Drosophila pandora]|nr:hypothetical protein KR067_012519 [Drosophila pandora]